MPLVFLAVSARAEPLDNPWAKVQAPATGPAQSIGTPTAGCVLGAVELPVKGKGYRLMRPERRRNYGHPMLVGLLRSIANELAMTGQSPLLIGDLGQARGGPTMSAHASHQTGLDVDVWYHRGKASTSAPSMVNKKSLKVAPTFKRAQIEMLKRFAADPLTDRILVHFAIKRELCKKHGSEDWIRKIRPWYGHDHHFHVRLVCAAGDVLCKRPEPIPTGNGCDATLDWWWSDEARQEETKNLGRQQNPVMPELPAECRPLLTTSDHT